MTNDDGQSHVSLQPAAADIPSSSSRAKRNTSLDYATVTTISAEEFALLISRFTPSLYTKSDPLDIRRIELMLDVKEGILADEDLYIEKYECAECGKTIQFSDFVYTSIKHAHHSKSFVLHTLLGTKHIRNEHRKVVCSSCGTSTAEPLNYMGNRYTCCNDIPK